MLLLISNSGHYIWCIYLNVAVTQTDECELGLWERYSLFSFFLFLCQKLIIVEQSCTFHGHFSLTSCHFLTAKYSNYLLSYSGFFWHILLYKYSTQYVSWKNNYVFFDTTIVQLWAWLMTTIKKIHDAACFFQLNTTGKGKLINQIESNSRMRSTFVWLNAKLSRSSILHINFDSMVPQRTIRHVCFIFPLS